MWPTARWLLSEVQCRCWIVCRTLSVQDPTERGYVGEGRGGRSECVERTAEEVQRLDDEYGVLVPFLDLVLRHSEREDGPSLVFFFFPTSADTAC